MYPASERFWFRCTICAEHWPGSRLGGNFIQANNEPICKDCASLVDNQGVVAAEAA